MDKETIYLLLGIAASIPISLAINLLTPAVQRKLEVGSTAAAQRRLDRQQKERERLEMLRKNPSQLLLNVVSSLLVIALVSSVFSLVANALNGAAAGAFAFSEVLPIRPEIWANVAYALSAGLWILEALFIINIAGRALRDIAGIRRLDVEDERLVSPA